MKSIISRPFSVSLNYYVLASAGFPTLACRGCRAVLDLHQPDQNQPEQFLATCMNCGRWYRVALTTSQTELTVLELPAIEQISATPPPSDSEVA